jgi:hypothetical protein
MILYCFIPLYIPEQDFWFSIFVFKQSFAHDFLFLSFLNPMRSNEKKKNFNCRSQVTFTI